MKLISLLLTIPFLLQAQTTPKSPQEIQAELDSAQHQLDQAKKMFNPWYTGPLLTPSASMVPPGFGMVQPYVFLAGNYARYNQNRNAESIPNLIQLKSSNILQFGVTKTVDFLISLNASGQWQSGEQGGGFDDIPATIGFLVYSETPYVPQIKFTIQETFPTGRYQHLSSNGLALSGVGQGSYQTQFGLGFGKLMFWSTQHPVNTRLFLGYNIATPVHVKGFNSYGGGHNTNGTVKPGSTFIVDWGIECTITQRWVFALDVAYTAQNRTKFNGKPGTLSKGAPATVGGGYNDNLSLAPAIEYNWSDSLGVVAGAWFSVYGRNSLAYAQGIFSVYWMFPPS